MTLVDQAGPEGVGGEFRTSDEDVIFRRLLSVVESLPDRTFAKVVFCEWK